MHDWCAATGLNDVRIFDDARRFKTHPSDRTGRKQTGRWHGSFRVERRQRRRSRNASRLCTPRRVRRGWGRQNERFLRVWYGFKFRRLVRFGVGRRLRLAERHHRIERRHAGARKVNARKTVDVVTGGLTANQSGGHNHDRSDADAHADREVHVGNASCNRCECFVVYFAGASCRSGRDAPRTSTAGNERREHIAAEFTTSVKRSLFGAEFPQARNVAPVRDLKSAPVVSSETDNPHQILRDNPVLSPTPVAQHVRITESPETRVSAHRKAQSALRWTW